MEKRRAVRTTLLLMGANFFARLFGLLREILLAKYYGAGVETDAYLIANNIPTVLFASIGASLATTFIPMYSTIRHEEGEERARLFTLRLIRVLLVICLVLTILGELFTEQFVALFASGFTGEIFSLTVSFTRILFPGIFVMALMNVSGCYLQLHNEFLAVAYVPICSNLTIIATLFLSQHYGNVYIFVWGTLLGLFAQIVFYSPFLIRNHLWIKKQKTGWNDPYLMKLLPLVLPVFCGEAVNEINSIVDRTLVSGLASGSVSALNYAYKVINLVVGVIVVSIMTLLYPEMAKLSAQREYHALADKVRMAIELIAVVMAFLTGVIICLGGDMIRVLFERGDFDTHTTLRTSGILIWYAVGLTGMGVREVLVKVFYSLKNTKIPMINGACCAFLNIVLSIILIKIMGEKGAAAATALVAILGSMNLFRMCDAVLNLKKKEIGVSLIKTLFLAGIMTGVMGLTVKRLKSAGEGTSLSMAQMLVVTCAMAVFYGVMQLMVNNTFVKDRMDEKQDRFD